MMSLVGEPTLNVAPTQLIDKAETQRIPNSSSSAKESVIRNWGNAGPQIHALLSGTG
jgi:hypothetical protein